MDTAIARLLDANANRAREALRVLEDYARFVLDHAPLQTQLKSLRHDLAAATAPFVTDAIAWRDTAGDIGTTAKTHRELHREDLSQVVIAAGKRLGEALRAIEEYAKIDLPDVAAAIEALRYRFYDIEKTLSGTLPGQVRARVAKVRLCVLITQSSCKLPWDQVAAQTLAGGADCLQLREKDLPAGELLRRAKHLVDLCHKHSALCIINDRPDIARLSGADGVHVGQDDLPVKAARQIVGSHAIVGQSTHNLDQARQAMADGADYIGVGPFFPSLTKPRTFVAGPAIAQAVACEIPLPAMAISGITETNLPQVLATGLTRIAVTAAITGSDDPRLATARLKAMLERVT